MNPQPPEPQSEALTNCATLTILLTTGAPCRIRTRGLRLRRPLLYPAELRARIHLSILLERETGFEPATYGLEGHRSSQLSYSRMFSFWSGREDSNFRPPAPKAGALTRLRYIPLLPLLLSTVEYYIACVHFVKITCSLSVQLILQGCHSH